jgi:MOSC domain-containing protein YiiM
MMCDNGTIKELYFSVKGLGRENPTQLDVDKDGVCLDKFYTKNINRSVLIASQDSYDLAKKNNIDVESGGLGENILIDINPYSLAVGSKVYVGEVILEITQHCTICKSLSKIDESLPEILKCDRGVFSKCIKSGTVRKGDSVRFEIKEK